MKKIKITALHLQHGGVEKVVVSMANLFVEMGYDTEIICTYNLGKPAYQIDKRVTVNYLTDVRPNRAEIKKALDSKNLFSLTKELIKAVNVLYLKRQTMIRVIKRSENCTIISTRNETSALLSKYSNSSVYKIAQLHHDHNFDKKLIHLFRTKFLNLDVFLLLNDTLTSEIEDFMRGYNTKTKCITLPNFIENRIIDKVVKKDNTVISVGRLHNDKGYDRLIEIWSEISKVIDNHKLLIVGDGELRQTLEAKSRDFGIEDSIIFKGMLSHEETIALVNQSKMFLMTSITEALPLVLIESMSQGTVPIAFDVRVGPRSIIDNKTTGFLVEDNDNETYIQTVTNYLQNYKLNNEIEQAGISEAQRYSKNNIMKIWAKVLKGAK